MAAVAGLRGTGDWGTDERPKNFREMISFRNPNGTAPLFALMAKTGSTSVNDPEFSWWDESNDLIRLQLDTAIDNNPATVAISCDTTDPDVTNPGNRYGTVQHLKPGDLLMFERTTELVAHDNEIVQVVSVDPTTNDMVVSRAAAGTTIDSHGDDSFLLKIGSAYAEGSAAPAATSRNPIKYTNLCQIFKTAYELTKTVEKTHARTGDVKKNDKARKVFDHSKDIEMALFFGQKFEGTGANGKPLRYMGGLREFIPTDTTTIFSPSVTLTQYLDSLTPVFDWDTRAGDERIAFCGNGYLNTLNALANLNGDVQFGNTIKAYGLNLRSFRLPQGTVYLRTHPLLNRHPQYRNSAFILDMSAIKHRYLRDTMFEDDIQNNGDDSRKGQWLSEISLEVGHGGLSCAYHGNFASVA